jgi:nucleoid-associated protein YgaU
MISRKVLVGRSMATLGVVSTVQPESPDDPRLRIFPPDEALRRARPLPPQEFFVLDGVPDEDWQAFEDALTEL